MSHLGNYNDSAQAGKKIFQKPCTVYVIGRVGGSNFSKIGISDNPENRLKSLQTGSPHRLFLAFQLEMRCRADAIEVESLAHELMDSARMNGEWFAISPEASRIVTLVADRFRLAPPCTTKRALMQEFLGKVERQA